MFPFNQPKKTRDCGYRCLYYVVHTPQPYDEWLNNFKFFTPAKNGITFTDICNVLDYYQLDHKFTQLKEEGLFIIYSGNWLKHGHYFVYHNSFVYDSTKNNPEKMPLTEVIKKLESKTISGAFRCLQVFV